MYLQLGACVLQSLDRSCRTDSNRIPADRRDSSLGGCGLLVSISRSRHHVQSHCCVPHGSALSKSSERLTQVVAGIGNAGGTGAATAHVSCSPMIHFRSCLILRPTSCDEQAPLRLRERLLGRNHCSTRRVPEEPRRQSHSGRRGYHRLACRSLQFPDDRRGLRGYSKEVAARTTEICLVEHEPVVQHPLP